MDNEHVADVFQSIEAGAAIAVVAVDDNPADLELLGLALASEFGSRLNYKGFDSIALAMAQIRAAEPDILFVDFCLPGRSGIEFLSSVRDERISSPAVLLTGSGSESVAVTALKSGFSDYLAKGSLSKSSIRRVVVNALQKGRLAKQAEEYRADLERTVEELAVRNEEISTFYHTLAHELKTPLTGAREYISIVLDGLLGPVTPDQQEVLTSAIGSCDQLRHCINDLFDVSRIETGKLRVNPDPGDLAAVVRQSVGCYAKQAQQSQIELVLDAPETLPQAMFDTQRILQVVNNLVGNALKFTPAGGQVEVVCAAGEPGFLEVQVSDTGEGIEPEALERVFDRLYQVEGNAAVKGGMGLGLHLCYQLVEMNGGQIQAVSELGAGTHFSFTVPLAG